MPRESDRQSPLRVFSLFPPIHKCPSVGSHPPPVSLFLIFVGFEQKWHFPDGIWGKNRHISENMFTQKRPSPILAQRRYRLCPSRFCASSPVVPLLPPSLPGLVLRRRGCPSQGVQAASSGGAAAVATACRHETSGLHADAIFVSGTPTVDTTPASSHGELF